MKTYVINLARSVDRRIYMKNLLNDYPSLDVEFIEAVDGKLMSEDERNKVFDANRFAKTTLKKVRPGEIGCTLSHQKCYKKIIDENISNCLIFEDDIIIKENIKGILREIENLLLSSKPTVVLLSGWFWYHKKRHLLENHEIAEVDEAYLTHAYALNKEAAYLMKDDRPWYVADDWKLFKKRGIKIFGLKPHPIDQDWGGGIATVVNDIKIEYIAPKKINRLKLYLRSLRKKILKLRGFESAERW